jgi:hypothetical protein
MNEHENDARVLLQKLSVVDFLRVGLNQIAYIKPVTIDGEKGFAVHSADGRQISVMDSYPVALALLRQHDLHPVTIQ